MIHSRTATDIQFFVLMKEIQSVQFALSICITVLNPPTAALIMYNINTTAYIYIYTHTHTRYSVYSSI